MCKGCYFELLKPRTAECQACKRLARKDNYIRMEADGELLRCDTGAESMNTKCYRLDFLDGIVRP